MDIKYWWGTRCTFSWLFLVKQTVRRRVYETLWNRLRIKIKKVWIERLVFTRVFPLPFFFPNECVWIFYSFKLLNELNEISLTTIKRNPNNTGTRVYNNLLLFVAFRILRSSRVASGTWNIRCDLANRRRRNSRGRHIPLTDHHATIVRVRFLFVYLFYFIRTDVVRLWRLRLNYRGKINNNRIKPGRASCKMLF